jgi:DNA-binding NarL/FixJ family response regulator
MHPGALTAVIDSDSHSHDSLAEILGSPLVRGVLPMNLRLDVWLAVIRLMLCGGEYYPPGVFRSLANTISRQRPAARPLAPGGNGHDLSGLTAREIQILEMVSRGLQNKTIAAEFALSEHTVKIHLHNIISKLGAHNRTEAAAKFRNFQLHNAPQALNQFPPSAKDRFAEPRIASLSAGRTKV